MFTPTPTATPVEFSSSRKGDSIRGTLRVDLAIDADISGDGKLEMIVPVDSGDTVGFIGVAVFAKHDWNTRALAWQSGYSLTMQVIDGQLVLAQPVFAADGVTQTGTRTTRHVLRGGQLVTVKDSISVLPSARVAAIGEHYRLLQVGEVAKAHALLGRDEQTITGYAAWPTNEQLGSNTRVIAIEEQADGSVRADLGETVTVPGGSITALRSVVWQLQWEASSARWVLAPPAAKL